MSNTLKVMRNLKVSCLFFAIFILKQKVEAGYFDKCDYTYNLNVGDSYLESPSYPSFYPPGTSCRYQFIAPLNHKIKLSCNISTSMGSYQCSTEHFYLSLSGDKLLRDTEDFCGEAQFIRKTLLNTLYVAYTSDGGLGNFRCQLKVQPPCICGWSVTTKISKGKDASPNEYPPMVALRDINTNMLMFCAATIISPRHLLTAAHCVGAQRNPAYIEALVGRHNLQSTTDTKYAAVYGISSIIAHPNYTSDPLNNDIAIYVTTKNIEFSRGVAPICLPPPSNAENDFAFSDVDVIGWGSTRYGSDIYSTLQKVTLSVPDHQACIKTFKNNPIVYPSQICTYDFSGNGKDSCQHDSGGPVIYKNINKTQFLVGVISQGIGCGGGTHPTGINTRVTSYLTWIDHHTDYSICTADLGQV